MTLPRDPRDTSGRRCLPALALAAATFAVCAAASLAARAQDDDARPETLVGTDYALSTIEKSIAADDTLLFKPVGTTSVVFRVRLAGSFDAAFKPQTTKHPRGDLAEVAAYRIARALGMRNVIPAVPRTLDLATIERQAGEDLDPPFTELRAQMVSDDGKTVRGTAIYWVPHLRELGIDTERGIAQWSRWLGQVGTPPYRDKSKLLARQISNMIAFDFLVGNWDRFSGANAQGDRSGRNLLVRDHNVAFYTPLPKVQQDRLIQHLQRVQRFSQSFVRNLKTLDEAGLQKALTRTDDPPGYAPLSPAQLEDVMGRRRTLLSYIAALIAQYGEERVMPFP